MDILTQILNLIEAEHPGVSADRARLERVIRVNFGRDRHYIASEDALDRATRDAEIRRAIAQRIPAAQIAERHGITPGRVRQIRHEIQREATGRAASTVP